MLIVVVVMFLTRFLYQSRAVVPIGGGGGGGLGAVAPKIPKKILFIGFIDSMFNICTCISSFSTRGVISTFSWGGQNFFLFFNATGLLKNWKKQHFICSNLTLFIVPFFLSFFLSFFSFFLSFFFLLFFSFFFFFFLFFFFLFPWGATVSPAPLK